MTISGIAKWVPSSRGRALHGHAGHHHDHQHGRRGGRIAAPAVPRVDDLAEFLFFLGYGQGEPAFPAPGQRKAPQPFAARAEHDDVRHQGGEHCDQPGGDGDQAEHGDQADRGHPDADHPAEENHVAVQCDAPRDDRAEAEERGQVEHVGADHDPGADLVLVHGKGGHGGGDLRCVCGKGRDHAEQCLGQADPLADPLQPGDQQVAGTEADGDPGHEDQQVNGHWHRVRSLPRAG